MDNSEDHFFYATFSIDNRDIPNIPTKLYLPKTIYEKPYAKITAPSNLTNRIFHAWKAKIQAEIKSGDRKILSIDIPEGYIKDVSTRLWGDNLTESTAKIEPQNLHIINHIESEKKPIKTHITFWLTPNKALTPHMFHSASYKGEIKHTRTEKIFFQMDKSLKPQFDLFFRHEINKQKTTQWSHLTCIIKSKIPASSSTQIKENILTKLDDFLLLTSFATRHTTKCLGWNASDHKCHTSFFRGNYAFPKQDLEQNEINNLISTGDFKEFIEFAYKKFECNNHIEHLRSAINAVTMQDNQTIETRFLHIFSGLESLILIFRRENNLEYALDITQWKILKKHIKESISSFSGINLNKETRSNIYSKLDELNRISINQAYNELKEKLSIFDKDLWPLFKTEDKPGLIDIRNKLIHGDTLPRSLMRPISIALDHLKYLTERVVIILLGWNIQRTNVHPYFLEHDQFQKQSLNEAITEISTYLQK